MGLLANHIKATGLRHILVVAVALTLFIHFPTFSHDRLMPIFDIDAAREVCDALPLDRIEGVWYYPDDKVTVLIRRFPDSDSSGLPVYQIMAVEATDCRIVPGDEIGKLTASPESSKYTLTLKADGRNVLQGKTTECMATLSKEGDSMILSKEKSKARLRINLNPNAILPALWRSLLRFGISVGSGNDPKRPSPGMIKVYPADDGYGILRNRPRYL